MKKMILNLTAVAMIASSLSPAYAAEDIRFDTGSQRSASRMDMGGQVSLKIALGGSKKQRSSERVQFKLSAGPGTVYNNTTGPYKMRSESNMASFTLKPNYSAEVKLAGQPVAAHYTRLGLQEQQQLETQGPRANLGSGEFNAGGVLVVVVVLGVLALVAQ
jgi:hypothetical protein